MEQAALVTRFQWVVPEMMVGPIPHDAQSGRPGSQKPAVCDLTPVW